RGASLRYCRTISERIVPRYMDQNDITYYQYGVNVEGILNALWQLLTGGDVGATANSFVTLLLHIWQIYSIIAFLISALLLFGLIYAKMRYSELEHHQHEDFHHAEEKYAHAHAHSSKNQRWEDALVHTDSENPNDWRLAIIEADIILEGVLNSLGYSGLTIG